ncbi:hypothetical protein [Roseibium sp.]|uniref:COG3904 family protein n=1 Tax=Roseibium sp. TaxID=1936156 RepID=UPI003B50BEC3
MEVRHNTSLLELAVNEEIRRSTIPLLEAEASANEKNAHAAGIRRLATGFAVGLAAVGIGWGISLAWPDLVPKIELAKQTEPEPKESPATRVAKSERLEVVPNTPKANTPVLPLPKPSKEGATPDIVTRNFNIFQERVIQLGDQKWVLKAGHFYENEQDKKWANAWCYTSIQVDGVDVRVSLASIVAPTSRPVAPVATRETLEHAGLTEDDAMMLASQCPWIDASFGRLYRYKNPRGRLNPFNPEDAKISLQGRVLFYDGAIDTDFVRDISRRQFDKLVINSIGGNVSGAIEGGRWLRRQRKHVEVRSNCYSSCVFVLSGGVERTAGSESKIGVHRFYSTTATGNDGVEIGQAMSSEIIRYFDEMGIDRQVFHAMADTPSQSMRLLSKKQLLGWRVLTSQSSTLDPIADATQPLGIDQRRSIARVTPPAIKPHPRYGVVRFEGGAVPLKVAADMNAIGVASFPNGTQVSIIEPSGIWYRVRVGNQIGFMHREWVKVDEYHNSPFEGRYIQIKSFRTATAAQSYVQKSSLPLNIFLGPNDWYAVTLRATYSQSEGLKTLNKLQKQRLIPDDSILTYGNTYLSKVCCEIQSIN